MIRRFVLPALSAALLVTPAATGAQSPRPTQVLSIQPISSIIGFYSGEYERVISPSVTFGVGASYFSGFVGEDNSEDDSLDDDDQYFSTEAKLRYYPGERPLEGFAFGGTVGFTSVSYENFDDDGLESTQERANGLKAGFELDYSWLLGRTDRFAVALGVGAKRLFISDIGDNDLTLAYPTGRIAVGFAF